MWGVGSLLLFFIWRSSFTWNAKKKKIVYFKKILDYQNVKIPKIICDHLWDGWNMKKAKTRVNPGMGLKSPTPCCWYCEFFKKPTVYSRSGGKPVLQVRPSGKSIMFYSGQLSALCRNSRMVQSKKKKKFALLREDHRFKSGWCPHHLCLN